MITARYVLCLLVACAFPVQAADTLLTNISYASECYKAASSPQERPTAAELRHGIDLCTDALELQTLSAKDRAATFSNRGLLHTRLGEHGEALVQRLRESVAADLEREGCARRDAEAGGRDFDVSDIAGSGVLGA